MSVALGPGIATGIGPELALGGSVSVAWAARRPNRALSSLGVELTALGTLTETIETASSRFWFFFARPELCSFGVVITRNLALVPCFGLELGAVTGVGSDIAEAATRTRFWAALDAELVLRVDVLGALVRRSERRGRRSVRALRVRLPRSGHGRAHDSRARLGVRPKARNAAYPERNQGDSAINERTRFS